jgi:hypothetical protein
LKKTIWQNQKFEAFVDFLEKDFFLDKGMEFYFRILSGLQGLFSSWFLFDCLR